MVEWLVRLFAEALVMRLASFFAVFLADVLAVCLVKGLTVCLGMGWPMVLPGGVSVWMILHSWGWFSRSGWLLSSCGLSVFLLG
jgi:hypothetical protein